jgi:iron complex outermembrane receptor protein
MKTTVITIISGCFFLNASAQIQVQDTTQIESLEEVLIKNVRVKADSPITHSNLDKEDLAARNLGQDIPFMLNYLPSVVTTSDAGTGIGYTYLRVRGSDGSRVNVTLNGIPFNDAESQGTFFVNLPDFTSSVESLQLQRGVGTSTNGSGAFGASLNLLTDGVSENANGEISNSFGSYNTRKHTVKFSTGLLNNHLEIAGRLSAIESDGYIDRASSDLKSYFLHGAFKDDNTLIKAITFGGREITYQAWNGIDGETLKNDRTFNSGGMYTDAAGNVKFYDNEVDNYGQDHYQLFWTQRYDGGWSSNLSMNYTYGRGYFEQFKEDADLEFHGISMVEIGDEAVTESDLIRRRWLDNDFYAINANVNYKNNELEVNTGAFYSLYDGDHYGEVIWSRFAGNSEIRDQYYSGNGEKIEFTLFGKATYRINDQWDVFGDLQGRFIQYTTSGLTSDKVPLAVDVSYDFFNPKAGVAFQLNQNNQFYFSYGRANREPRRSDFEQGIFTPEKLDDFEMGWRFASDKVTLSSNLFYMNYTDQLVLTGALDDVGAPIRATSGNSYRLGVEMDMEIRAFKNLKILPNIALSTNKNQDFVSSKDGELVNLGNTDISFSPSVIVGNAIVWEPLDRLNIGLLSKFVGEQFMGNIDSEVSRLDSYFINDVNITYTLEKVPFVREIAFSALVNNVFNVAYVSNGYFFTYVDDFSEPDTITTVEGAGFYPQATTNFLLGATVKF